MIKFKVCDKCGEEVTSATCERCGSRKVKEVQAESTKKLPEYINVNETLPQKHRVMLIKCLDCGNTSHGASCDQCGSINVKNLKEVQASDKV